MFCVKEKKKEENRGKNEARMSELKDPAIKLFGKTISLPQYEDVDSSTIDDKIDRLRLHHHHHGGGCVRRDNQSFSATTAASEDDKVFWRI